MGQGHLDTLFYCPDILITRTRTKSNLKDFLSELFVYRSINKATLNTFKVRKCRTRHYFISQNTCHCLSHCKETLLFPVLQCMSSKQIISLAMAINTSSSSGVDKELSVVLNCAVLNLLHCQSF